MYFVNASWNQRPFPLNISPDILRQNTLHLIKVPLVKSALKRRRNRRDDRRLRLFYVSLASAVKHFSVDSQLGFCVVLFVPCRAPFALFATNTKHINIKLHFRRVFLMKDCDVLIVVLNFDLGAISRGFSSELLLGNTAALHALARDQDEHCQ